MITNILLWKQNAYILAQVTQVSILFTPTPPCATGISRPDGNCFHQTITYFCQRYREYVCGNNGPHYL